MHTTCVRVICFIKGKCSVLNENNKLLANVGELASVVFEVYIYVFI